MGALEYLSDLLARSSKHKKRKQMQTVELKVRMDCDGCELKVKNAVSSMKGVKSVDINRKQHKVTVTGYVEPGKVLKKVNATGKRAEIWPYMPYNMVAHPYDAKSYDKKAPAGYVRKVEYSAVANTNSAEEEYSTLFSDDNPNACCII
uniref:HMA domain-containing protein n=1 Tax=Araucaria cunninghamii TaxID=56994 RepID=A0A0D6QY72_ARACU